MSWSLESTCFASEMSWFGFFVMIPVIGGFSDLAKGLSCYFVVWLLDGIPVIDFEVLFFFAGND